MTSAGIAIRAAVPCDANELSRMADEFASELVTLPVGLDAAPIPEADDVALTADILRRDIFGAVPLAHILLAEEGADQLGYLMYHFGYWPADAAPSLHIVDLFVRKTMRKRGVARALMHAAGALVRQKGGRRLIWTVWDQNHPAMAFYQRLGARFFAEERLMTMRL